jgi:hypothetical protein
MKPLQNQYQDLLEGKMSKYNFLNNIKRSLPNLVSNITSFDDAVSILKSKRILSENISNTAQMGGVTSSKGTAGYIDNTDKKGGDYDPKQRAASLSKLKNFGLKKSIKEISASSLKPNSNYEYSGGAENTVLKYVGKREDNPNIKAGSSMGKGHIFQWPDGKYFELGPISVMKYIEFSDTDEFDTDEYSQEISNRYDREQEKHTLPGGNMLEKKHTFDEVLNKLSEGKYTLNKYINEIDNVNPIEYQNGISFEVDLAGDFSAQGLEKAVKKVLKNLKKDPIYYTNLKSSLGQKINKKIKSSEYTELKKDNQLDKHNQLKTLVKKEMANTKITQSKQEKASKAMPKGVKLMKEIKLEDVKSLLSNETIRNSNIGYGVGDSTGNEVSITYKNYKKLPFEDFSKLEDKYQVYQDILSSEDEPTTIQYFISDKFKSSTPSKPKIFKQASDEDERIFETDDYKKRQKKDFEKFSAKMIGKPSTKQNTIKDKIKEYVVKQLKKEAVKFTIGADKEYVSDVASKEFENKLRTAGVTKFTKSKVQ